MEQAPDIPTRSLSELDGRIAQVDQLILDLAALDTNSHRAHLIEQLRVSMRELKARRRDVAEAAASR